MVEYINKFKSSFLNLKNLFNDLPKLRTFDHIFNDKTVLAEKIEEYAGENKEIYLSKLELL